MISHFNIKTYNELRGNVAENNFSTQTRTHMFPDKHDAVVILDIV